MYLLIHPSTPLELSYPLDLPIILDIGVIGAGS
jgi:hypothetical protein